MERFKIRFWSGSNRLGMRDKGVKETGVKDTHFWCKQLGGVVPVTEGGSTRGEADLRTY